MSWQPSSRRSPIGIEASGRCINAVQLRPASGRWRVEAAISLPRRDEAPELDAEELIRLGDALYRQGFRGNDVVLALPDDHLMTSVLELPAGTPAGPIPQIARARLAAAHRCEPQALEVACWDLPGPARAQGAVWAFAVGCRTDEANGLVDLFEDAGMDVRAIDVPCWAAVRACSPRLDGTSQPTAVLDLGWTAAQLVVLCHGLVVHLRALPEHGLQRLYTLLTEEFGLEGEITDYIIGRIGMRPDLPPDKVPSEALAVVRDDIVSYLMKLAAELRRSLDYATQEYAEEAVQRLVVHGEGASVPGLTEYLSAALDVPVKTVAPTDVADCAPALAGVCKSPTLTTALGLAQHPGDS